MQIFIYTNNPRAVLGSIIVVGVIFHAKPPQAFLDIDRFSSNIFSTVHDLMQIHKDDFTYVYKEITPQMLSNNKTLAYKKAIDNIVFDFKLKTNNIIGDLSVLLHRTTPYTDLDYKYSLNTHKEEFHVANIISHYYRHLLLKSYDALYPNHKILNHKGILTNNHLSILATYGVCDVHHSDLVDKVLDFLTTKIEKQQDKEIVRKYVKRLPDWWTNAELSRSGRYFDTILDYFSADNDILFAMCNKLHLLLTSEVNNDDTELSPYLFKMYLAKKRYIAKFKEWLRSTPDPLTKVSQKSLETELQLIRSFITFNRKKI